MAFIKEDYLQFKQEVRAKLASMNASGTYASDWFPVQDNEAILRFLKDDSGLEKRKDCLYLLLSSCDDTSARKFSDSFLNNLFTKEYLATYIWPHGW